MYEQFVHTVADLKLICTKRNRDIYNLVRTNATKSGDPEWNWPIPMSRDLGAVGGCCKSQCPDKVGSILDP